MNPIIKKRILAYLIDMVIICFPMYIFILFFWEDFIHLKSNNFLVVVILIQFLPFFVYFLLSEFFFKKTLGKKLLKLEVICYEKRFYRIFIRTICRLIPLDLITFLFYEDKLLHDVLSQTSVELN